MLSSELKGTSLFHVKRNCILSRCVWWYMTVMCICVLNSSWYIVVSCSFWERGLSLQCCGVLLVPGVFHHTSICHVYADPGILCTLNRYFWRHLLEKPAMFFAFFWHGHNAWDDQGILCTFPLSLHDAKEKTEKQVLLVPKWGQHSHQHMIFLAHKSTTETEERNGCKSWHASQKCTQSVKQWCEEGERWRERNKGFLAIKDDDGMISSLMRPLAASAAHLLYYWSSNMYCMWSFTSLRTSSLILLRLYT